MGLIPFGLVRFPDVQRLERIEAGPGTSEEVTPLVAVAFEGIVLDSAGAPTQGASVVSSAGGQTTTDRNGKYRLEVDVPLEAGSIEITAIGGAGELVATRQVSIGAGSEVTWLQPIELPGGSTCQPSWLPTFGVDPGQAGYVHAMAEFDDGSGPALYVAGNFQEFLGIGADCIVKWDGARWSKLETQLQASEVRSLAVFDDGSGPALYAGGNLSVAGSLGVAKWDGSSWTALGAGLGGFALVYALAVFDDGSGPALYAGGLFASAWGAPGNNIAKWDGSSWTALGSGVPTNPNEVTVRALAVFDDGNGAALYAGGAFLGAGGVAANYIAKWNGTGWSGVGGGVSGSTYALVVDLAVFDAGSGPKLYAGGIFSRAGSTTAVNIARWDGTGWGSLGTGVSGSFVESLGVFDDGSGPALYAGGGITTAGGEAVANIARWDGSGWSALGSGIPGVNVGLGALQEFDDGSGPALYVGGAISTAGGLQTRKVARWDGSSWSSFGKFGLTPSVDALSVFDDGLGPALYAGGSFRIAAVALPQPNQVAKWNGSSWMTIGGMNDKVNALATFDDGGGPELYAAGAFLIAGGVQANRIAKWDGASWSRLSGNPSGLNDSVSALTVFDDGSGPALYAGGAFTTAGGGSALRAARWDGSGWSGLGSGLGPSGSVRALAAHDDGSGPKLYAGGSFSTAGGLPANRIARWNGSSWAPLGSGMNDDVRALVSFDDGNGAALYAGGEFTTAGGIAANRIARWNGTSWEPVGLGLDGDCFSLSVFDDGCGPALYIGGRFTTAGGVAASRIAKWDGTTWSALGALEGGTTPQVLALAGFNDRTGAALYAGGRFGQALPAGDSHLAKWGRPDTSAPIITCPESVVVHDLVGPPGEVVNLQVTVEDAEDYRPDVVFDPPSGSHFPRGTTLVTCTATDASGNQANCQFPVTVVESDFRAIRPQPR